MISVEVTETGVSLSKVTSDMPRFAKAILKKAVTHYVLSCLLLFARG